MSWDISGVQCCQLFALNAKNTNGFLCNRSSSADLYQIRRATWEGNLGSLIPFVLQDRFHYKMTKHMILPNMKQLSTGSGLLQFVIRWSEQGRILLKTALCRDASPSEFAMSGVLGDLNVTGRLIVKTMQQQIKYSERVLFPHSGHFRWWMMLDL